VRWFEKAQKAQKAKKAKKPKAAAENFGFFHPCREGDQIDGQTATVCRPNRLIRELERKERLYIQNSYNYIHLVVCSTSS
jgi:hypothetical protein